MQRRDPTPHGHFGDGPKLSAKVIVIAGGTSPNISPLITRDRLIPTDDPAPTVHPPRSSPHLLDGCGPGWSDSGQPLFDSQEAKGGDEATGTVYDARTGVNSHPRPNVQRWRGVVARIVRVSAG